MYIGRGQRSYRSSAVWSGLEGRMVYVFLEFSARLMELLQKAGW